MEEAWPPLLAGVIVIPSLPKVERSWSPHHSHLAPWYHSSSNFSSQRWEGLLFGLTESVSILLWMLVSVSWSQVFSLSINSHRGKKLLHNRLHFNLYLLTWILISLLLGLSPSSQVCPPEILALFLDDQVFDFQCYIVLQQPLSLLGFSLHLVIYESEIIILFPCHKQSLKESWCNFKKLKRKLEK